MTTPGEEPQDPATPAVGGQAEGAPSQGRHSPEASLPGSYGEIAPGVPRYGQYAPEGWQPPQDVADAQKANTPPSTLQHAPSYPGFGGARPPGSAGFPIDPATHLAPPNRVMLATRLIMTAGMLQIVALIVWGFAMTTPAGQELLRGAVEQAMASNPQAAATVSEEQLFSTVIGFMAALQAVCAAGYFWIAAKLRRGRNWARITALVLAILSIALVPEGGEYSFYTGARIILGLVAVFMLFRSPAKEFFLAHKARKAGNSQIRR